MSARHTVQSLRVLAIDPYTRGIGFVVLEGKEKLVDWGLREARTEKHARCVRHAENLITMYQPELLVLEDIYHPTCRRCIRVQQLLRDISLLASGKGLRSKSVSRQRVLATFSSAKMFTKYELADSICSRFPELTPWRPTVRKAWLSEDPRQSIFDAAVLALTVMCRVTDLSSG